MVSNGWWIMWKMIYNCLVLTGTMEWIMTFHSVGNVILSHLTFTPWFFRGVGIPPTSIYCSRLEAQHETDLQSFGRQSNLAAQRPVFSCLETRLSDFCKTWCVFPVKEMIIHPSIRSLCPWSNPLIGVYARDLRDSKKLETMCVDPSSSASDSRNSPRGW